MIALKTRKGENEIISTILIMLIMVIVVGIIIAGVTSQISKGKEKTNYDNSIKVRDQLFSDIKELYNSPIESTKEINISLSNLILDINAEGDVIEICVIGKKFDFFDEGKRVEQDNNKYVYRELQKVCSGVSFDNIDLVRSYQINNRDSLRLVIKKITENKIQFSLDNETTSEWYTQKNSYVYDETISGDWKYRKKILIYDDNLTGDLNNLSVQLDLQDEALQSYANSDASDIIFTLGDGITKLKREIVDYNSDTGALSVLIKGPQFNYGPDINNPIYDDNTYRKKITIDHTKVDADLNDFPVLINISDSDLANVGANADGNDIYFTASDGETKLKREIEYFIQTISYRKKITIDHTKVDANLTNFPILIDITDSDLANHGANSDGNDIYFASSDGTKLKREIEDYNSETGALVAWVKIPALPSTIDTNIYINFGDPEENNTNDTDVWDSDFAMVQHFNNSTLDSTSHHIDGNITGSLTLIEDRFGKESAYKFEPGKYITIPKPFDQNNLEQIWTVDAWYKISNKSITQSLFKYNYGSGFNRGLHIMWAGVNPLLYLNVGANDYYTYGNGSYIYTETWQKITYRFRNSDGYRKIYVNGVDRTTSGPNATSTPFGIASTVIIGDCNTADLDELRISTTLRSDSWIKTEYNNQSAPSTFSSVGDLETIYGSLVAWVKIPNLSSTTDTDIYLYFGDENESNTNDTDVWDVNFVFVNHLNENLLESTYRANNFINSGSIKTTGKINSAFDFNGLASNRMITTTTSNDYELKNSDFTMSGWFYIPTEATQLNWGGIMIGDSYVNGIDLACGRILSGTGTPLYMNFSSSVPRNTWYYLTLIHSVSEKKGTVYFNGNYNLQDTYPDTLPATNKKIYLAQDQGYLTGKIDEVRISNIARSEDWIKTEYNNQASPETFSDTDDLEIIEHIIDYEILPNPLTAPIYIYFGNPDANISDNSIDDSNTATISVGVLEKS